MDNFGINLRKLREKAGLSQGQLAEKAGLGIRQISRLETGASIATWPTVLALAAALGVDCRAFQVEAKNAAPRGKGRPKGK